MNTFDLVAFIYRQRAFSRATYGTGKRPELQTQIARCLAAMPDAKGLDSLHCWVDIVLLALDGAWRSGTKVGVSPQSITEELAWRQEKIEEAAAPAVVKRKKGTRR